MYRTGQPLQQAGTVPQVYPAAKVPQVYLDERLGGERMRELRAEQSVTVVHK
jgi:hypothetical protein